MAGRPPFPRTAPPYRHGADEVGHDITDPAGTSMADSQGFTGASATLVNNVATFANLPYIVLHGPEQFRPLGTPESPRTMICTVTRCTERAGYRPRVDSGKWVSPRCGVAGQAAI